MNNIVSDSNIYNIKYKIDRLIKPTAILRMEARNIFSTSYLRERINNYDKYSLIDLSLATTHLCINKYITSVYPLVDQGNKNDKISLYAICSIDSKYNGYCELVPSNDIDYLKNKTCEISDKYHIPVTNIQSRLIGYYTKEIINIIMEKPLYKAIIEVTDCDFIISPHKTVVNGYDDNYKCTIIEKS
jgi:hypothetical protein